MVISPFKSFIIFFTWANPNPDPLVVVNPSSNISSGLGMDLSMHLP